VDFVAEDEVRFIDTVFQTSYVLFRGDCGLQFSHHSSGSDPVGKTVTNMIQLYVWITMGWEMQAVMNCLWSSGRVVDCHDQMLCLSSYLVYDQVVFILCNKYVPQLVYVIIVYCTYSLYSCSACLLKSLSAELCCHLQYIVHDWKVCNCFILAKLWAVMLSENNFYTWF